MGRARAAESAAWLIAVVFATMIANLELHTDDDGIVAGIIIGCTFLAAMIRPVKVWRWALLPAIAIVTVEVWTYYHEVPRRNVRLIVSFGILFAALTAFGLVERIWEPAFAVYLRNRFDYRKSNVQKECKWRKQQQSTSRR